MIEWIYTEWVEEWREVFICSDLQEKFISVCWDVISKWSGKIWQNNVDSQWAVGHATTSLAIMHCGCWLTHKRQENDARTVLTWTGLLQHSLATVTLSISKAGPRPLGGSALEIGRVTWTWVSSRAAAADPLCWKHLRRVCLGIWSGVFSIWTWPRTSNVDNTLE